MVRFPCFNAHVHLEKSKKAAEFIIDAIPVNSQVTSQTKGAIFSSMAMNECSSVMKLHQDIQVSDPASTVSVDCGWKNEEISNIMDAKNDEPHSASLLKKSHSLGSNLCHQTETSYNSDAKVVDQTCSILMNADCVFSIGDPYVTDKDFPEILHETSFSEASIQLGSSNVPCWLSLIGKSCSFSNNSSSTIHALSCYDNIIDNCPEMQALQEQGGNDIESQIERNYSGESLDDGYDSYICHRLTKGCIVPAVEENNLAKSHYGEYSIQMNREMLSRDFKKMRIEHWVNDLANQNAFEEAVEISESNDPGHRNSTTVNGGVTSKLDTKFVSGLEVAKNHITSLSASCTNAQLANHNLERIPFLGACAGLKVLNLSGNCLVRIIAGALPRGLHILNLSKNNIGNIEGLRELTRLRVLDLSFNRILRIGHGLASCSSLKELYLAGNKISEVEGLHRLLKLTVLDLRFNKISMTKCLGQLAANYNSLQAITLEGNPAQKNVGDEQLRKCLQSLLPRLVYFNQQPTKPGTLKDATERSVRLGIGAYQFDRSLRLDCRTARKATHCLSSKRPSGMYAHKLSTGNKEAANHRHHYFDVSNKLLDCNSQLSITRSRSEGRLGLL